MDQENQYHLDFPGDPVIQPNQRDQYRLLDPLLLAALLVLYFQLIPPDQCFLWVPSVH